MDISVGISGLKSPDFYRMITKFSSSFRFRCSKSEPPQNGGDKSSTDWDKAWKNFKKQSKKTLFSQFNVDKYVTWNPRRSEFPLSEEVDPIKRTERSNLMLWTSPRFTLIGAIVIVSFLLLYTILAPVKGHQNSLEMMPIYFILMVLGGMKHSCICTGFGLLYNVRRFFYFKGYSTRDSYETPNHRKYAFLAMFGLTICTISLAITLLCS